MSEGNPSIQTYTGKMINIFDPKPELIDIYDIAHTLPQLVRWNGHVGEFYSVGAHSVQVAKRIKAVRGSVEEQLAGLLHDASEAYVSDVPRPIKRHPDSQGLRDAETRLQEVIFQRFGLPWPMPEIVHTMDTQCLVHEAKVLFVYPHEWVKAYSVDQDFNRINAAVDDGLTSPAAAAQHGTNFPAIREEFMRLFIQLGGGIR